MINKNICIDKMEKVVPKILIEGINKETRPAEGIIEIGIELGKKIFPKFPFVVMDKIDYDIVIGADFIRKYRIIINIAENTILYRKN